MRRRALKEPMLLPWCSCRNLCQNSDKISTYSSKKENTRKWNEVHYLRFDTRNYSEFHSKSLATTLEKRARISDQISLKSIICPFMLCEFECGILNSTLEFMAFAVLDFRLYKT